MLHSLSFTLSVLKGSFNTEMTAGCRNAPNGNSHTLLTHTEPSLCCPVPQTKGAQNQDLFFYLYCPFSHLQKEGPAPATTESGVKALNRGVQQKPGHSQQNAWLFSGKKKVKSSSCGISLILWGTEQPLGAEGPEDANKCPLATSQS